MFELVRKIQFVRVTGLCLTVPIQLRRELQSLIEDSDCRSSVPGGGGRWGMFKELQDWLPRRIRLHTNIAYSKKSDKIVDSTMHFFHTC